MNRYEMEPILNPTGRFVIYEEHSDPMPKELWLKAGRSWELLKG